MNKETLSTSETAKEAPKIKLALEEKYEEEKKNLTPEPDPIFSGVKGSGSGGNSFFSSSYFS